MNGNMIQVTIDGQKKQYPRNIRLLEIAKDFEKPDGMGPRIVLAVCDGKLRELHKKLRSDCTLQFVTEAEPAGNNAYRRTACMILYKALYDIEKELMHHHAGETKKSGTRHTKSGDEEGKDPRFILRFAVPDGYYFSLDGDLEVTVEMVELLRKRMQEIVDAGIPVIKRNLPIEEAVEIFSRQGMDDKEKLFRYRRVSRVNVYSLENYCDYFYGFMVPDTSYIRRFHLRIRDNGIVLALPTAEAPDRIPEIPGRSQLFQVLKSTDEWGDRINISTVGELNDRISQEGARSIIMMQEAIQEAKIAQIANDIVNRRTVRFVMIAGPSSSGKTSFSYRLSIQLSALGLRPRTIALDDYFLDRELTPLDEFGEKDYESLGALNIPRFNQDMLDLLAGKKILRPSFNFITGKSESSGELMELEEGDILVLEGIHGLNDELSYALPKESKYKIYVSPLTQFNIDYHNTIPATDERLIRRIVRDARTRGITARETIARWPSVRRGEEKNVIPFEDDADALLNSALVYELGALKVYVEPLLFAIDKDEPAYLEAHRLLKFLDYFLPVPSDDVPNNSLLREFIGGSLFRV